MRVPDYGGGSLVNLVAELERRLTGSSPEPGLHDHLSEHIPSGQSYLLVLIDGLGDHQLDHRRAAGLAASRRTALDAPFPTTTSASLASLVTGLPPRRHGLIGYQLWLPEHQVVVNTLKWTTLWGDPIEIDTEDFLPSPNLWERLGETGVETATVQASGFLGSPLSRALYRGTRFEPVWTAAELVEASLTLVGSPGRLVLTYLPQVDVAAHTHGQESQEYEEAISFVARIWERLTARLPSGVVAVATADHGHVDVPAGRRTEIPRRAEEGLTLYGDPRAVFVRGEEEAIARLIAELPGSWASREEVLDCWGPGPDHPEFAARVPRGVLMARPGHMLLHRFSDQRLIGAHGGLTEEELRIPLLTASGPTDV